MAVLSSSEEQSFHESWVEGQKAEDAYRNSHVIVISILEDDSSGLWVHYHRFLFSQPWIGMLKSAHVLFGTDTDAKCWEKKMAVKKGNWKDSGIIYHIDAQREGDFKQAIDIPIGYSPCQAPPTHGPGTNLHYPRRLISCL